MKKIMKRPINLTIAFLLVFAIVLSILMLKNNATQDAIVLTVNGEEITAEEFKQFSSRNWHEVLNFYIEKYEADGSGDFWNTPINGKLPSEKLKEVSLNQAVSAKVRQIIAKENGILEDISYEAFLKNLKQENMRRNQMLKKGEVIYGPVQYDAFNYFDYVHSNMEIRLKERLKHGYVPDENEIKLFYETYKDSLFKKADRIEINQIYVPYLGPDAHLSQEQAKLTAEVIRTRLIEGESFEKLAADYQIKQPTHRIFDEETKYNDEKYYSELLKRVKALEIGNISDVLDIPNGQYRTAGYYIIECKEKSFQGYKPYEEVKDQIKDHLFEDWYQKLISDRVKNAEVEINHAVYDTLQVH